MIGKGRAKEGLSLFGIMDHTVISASPPHLTLQKSSSGRRLLRTWFLRPPTDIEVIHDRLGNHHTMTTNEPDTISFLMEHRDYIKELQACLSHMKDTFRIMGRMRTAKSSIADWKNILQACYHSLKMKEIVQTMPENQLKVFEKVGKL
jgi:DNA mismatch repair ATPase MutS